MATLQTKAGRSGLPYKWAVAIVVIFGAFMTILDQTIVNIALPRLQSAFRADLNSVQWVITAYILTQGVCTPTTAFFVDRLGTKRFYLIALGLFTLGSGLCGLAWNLPTLIIFRIVQGIGGAFLFPLASTLLFNEFPLEERGTASAFIGIAALLAPAVGPTLGGYIVTYADWPLIFYVNIPFGILGLVLAFRLLREARPERGIRFDVLGFSLVSIGLATLLYALSDANIDGWSSTKIIGLLLISVVLLTAFVAIELRRTRSGEQALVNLNLFANRPFLLSNIASGLVTFAFFGGLFLFPIYLQSLRGLTALQSGLLLLPQAVASIAAALICGRIVDRVGARPVVIPGTLLLAFTLWQCSGLTLATPYWYIEIIYVLRGLALGMILQPLNVAALSQMQPRQIAQASSLFTVVRFVSTSLGVAVLATLVQSQASVHTKNLVQQVMPFSQFGQRIKGLQDTLTAHGFDVAQITNVRQGLSALQHIGFMQALQDAFWLTLPIVCLASFTAIFLRRSRPTPAEQKNVNEELNAENAIPLMSE